MGAGATNGGRAPRRVAVVGGGVAGLAAAWQLTGGAGGPGADAPQVVVLEADDQVGGKLRTGDFGGHPVDLGPDGFLGRRPEGADLCREVGLGDHLRPVGRSGAAVFSRGRRRRLPDALALGIPTRFWPTARSGILGARGTARLLLDVVAPRPDSRGPLGDRAVGPLVARKLGQRVVDRLVDPLLGGIHAGGVADMSTAAAYPLLLALAQRRGSFMRLLRQATARAPDAPSTTDRTPPTELALDDAATRGLETADEPAPLFWSLEGGLQQLTDRLASQLEARGVLVRTASPVELIDRGRPGDPDWVLHTPEGPVLADGVVLAVPAARAAALLEPHDAEASRLLGGIEYASVVTVTLTYHPDDVPSGLQGTGLLVPRATPVPRRRGEHDRGSPSPEGNGNAEGIFRREDTFLVTACTYLSDKWPHLAHPGEVLVRASVGRFGDDRAAVLSDPQLVRRVVAELELLLGTSGRPIASLVTRWPESLPQYRVHHLLRVTGIESALLRLPAVAVAGASYRGVGIPACIASGRAAADHVLEAIAERPGQPSGAGPGP